MARNKRRPYLFFGQTQVHNVDEMAEDDSRLLKEARRGDESSFLSLYQRHRTPLFRFAWRLTGSTATAEDIVQECWMLILQRAHFREDCGSVRGYLFGIVRNLAFARLRIRDRESDESADGETDRGPFEDVLAAERSEAVAHAVAALAPLQREALILFEYEDLSLDEIAQATGVDIGAVKARLHRARETLRRRLAPLMATRPAQGRCS
jgi:RNA polymerase sigma-70 factor (ECF subfamily)